MRTALLTAALLLLPARSAGEPITVRITPRISFAPRTIHVVVLLAPHHENRAVCIQWGIESQSETGKVRTSCESVGEDQRRVYFDLRCLPSGDYDLAAMLYRQASASIPFRILHAKFNLIETVPQPCDDSH